MPGMGSGLSANDPTIVSAFHAALQHQGLVVLVILALLGGLWNALRVGRLLGAGRHTAGEAAAPTATPEGSWSAGGTREAPARRVLRLAFGCLWVLDGLLQAQSAMPLGLTAQVIQPGAATSPGWVRHLVDWGVTVWSDHPIAAASSAVWIQLGIGILLLVAPRGWWSRLAGAVSVAWGLVVWVLGESFGGIFAPGLSWLFGAPGAAALYCVAGALLALPERCFATRRLGRMLLGSAGIFLVGMAILQAWPGRGFWQGRFRGGTGLGGVATMVTQMSATAQPHFLSSWLRSFESFDAAHGWAVNLVVVILLGAIGLALVSGDPRAVPPALVGAAALCLADWVLVQDLGFLGGVGTDPNSMLPLLAVLGAGYAGLVRAPADASAHERDRDFELQPALAGPGAPRLRRWAERSLDRPAYLARVLAALAAIAIILVGAAPMALASANPDADPIIWQATNGTPDVTDVPAPNFSLVDQNGRPVTLESLRGRAIALTFLDPVCTNDCPLIAQEFRLADKMLGSQSPGAVFVAVVANPLYRSTTVTRAFDRVEGLAGIPNWLYLTGTPSQLRDVWDSFGIQVQVEPGGSMVAHSELAYVIDATGHTRYVLGSDPGSRSAASSSSFAGVLATEVRAVLRSP